MEHTRSPAVAGYFYPGESAELERTLAAMLERASGPPSVARAVIAPHAGYVYSGAVAAEVFGAVEVPDRVVVLGPKHRHAGSDCAVSAASAWSLPTGAVPVDRELSALLVEELDAVWDDRAHEQEHSLEVQVPFLRHRNPSVRIAALALGFQPFARVEELGVALARAVERLETPALIVASTDMSHHIPEAEARRLDRLALERVEALDARGLYETVVDNGISMCGVVPTAVALVAARRLGAQGARLVRYANSGEVTGDRAAVVGYAGLILD